MDLSVLLNEEISEEELLQLIDEDKVTSMSQREVHTILTSKGWGVDRTDGGHTVYAHPKSKNKIPVPRKNVIAIGTVRQILKKSDPDYVDPKMPVRLNNGYMETNKHRIIQEAIKNALERRKKKAEDPDKFIPNPELSSEITKT